MLADNGEEPGHRPARARALDLGEKWTLIFDSEDEHGAAAIVISVAGVESGPILGQCDFCSSLRIIFHGAVNSVRDLFGQRGSAILRIDV